jgi:hypothetical protein
MAEKKKKKKGEKQVNNSSKRSEGRRKTRNLWNNERINIKEIEDRKLPLK